MSKRATEELKRTFLHRLSYKLIDRYGTDPEGLIIVLPSKRSRLFLYRAWADAAGTPVWAPKILTMEEFVFNTLSLKSADEITLALALWKVCKETPGFDLSFEQFSGWATTLLRDFNETDHFLADAKQVFTNLKEAKELTLWVPGAEDQLSEHEKLYIEFYNKFYPWYLSFRKYLLQKKNAYQGLAFRELAESPETLTGHFKGNRVVFAGFNAFTPAEEKIIDILRKSNLAEVVWDADEWYIKDEMQEAGHFIRKWLNKNPEFEGGFIENELAEGEKNITVIGVQGNRAQARLAGEILSEIKESDPETAVVLPDESLLLPVLNSIPKNITEFNVTMGISFKHSAAMSWIKLNLQLFHNYESSSKGWFRVLHLLPVIKHHWFKILTNSDRKTISAAVDPTDKFKKRFYSPDWVIKELSDIYPAQSTFIKQFFQPVDSPFHFIEKIEKSVRILLQEETALIQNFDRGALLETLRILKLISETLLEAEEKEEGFVLLRYILNRLLQSATVPFTGEPLKGIQILGLLETRNLDFENVIILSANERILPSARKPATLIPYDIRKHHGLPGIKYHDSIFAYHFYRLIQKAKNINIIYNSDISSDLSGEMTRYIRQIDKELVRANKNIRFKHYRIPEEITSKEIFNLISIEKSDPVYNELLYKLQHKGLSPTQLTKYIKCPLMFYYSFVAGIKESEEFEETIDAKELGNLVHFSLQNIYDPKKHRKQQSSKEKYIEPMLLDEDFFKGAITIANKEVENKMQSLISESKDIMDHNKNSATVKGKNLIIMEVAKYMVKNFLKTEKSYLDEHKIEIIDVESKIISALEVPIKSKSINIKFKGFIDRIDRFDGIVRVNDYKTGAVQKNELVYKSLDDIFNDPKKEKAFQLLFYCWLYSKQENIFNITSGLFPLKSSKTYIIDLPALQDRTPEYTKEVLTQFEERLVSLCKEILDNSLPFKQTENLASCKFCPYHPVCLTDLTKNNYPQLQ